MIFKKKKKRIPFDPNIFKQQQNTNMHSNLALWDRTAMLLKSPSSNQWWNCLTQLIMKSNSTVMFGDIYWKK